MAKGRMIDHEITSDKRIHNLSNDTSRLSYTWLITYADCEGRTYGDPAVVRSMLFPRREDVSIQQMEEYIKEWSIAGLILWYEAQDDRWIYFPAFESHNKVNKDREAPSKIPAPTPEQLQTIARPNPDQLIVNIIEDKLMEENIKENISIIPQISSPNEILNQPLQSNISITPIQAWDKLKDSLAGEMKRDLFIDKLSSTKVIDYSPGLFTIGTKSDYQSEWLESRLRSKILKEMTGICNRAIDVKFVKSEVEVEDYTDI